MNVNFKKGKTEASVQPVVLLLKKGKKVYPPRAVAVPRFAAPASRAFHEWAATRQAVARNMPLLAMALFWRTP